MTKAPFPYFGGKSTVASEVLCALGPVDNYVEPFCGSCAVLLANENPPATETVNDADGLLCNVWRALKLSPTETAHHADWPVNECDLHARHLYLVGQRESITDRLMGDPDWHDPRLAGWWIWGACAWIGSGFCSGEGPWVAVDGRLVDSRELPDGRCGQGVRRQRPHLGNRGQGINRQLPHLGDRGEWIAQWFQELSDRLRDVRVCCGDWQRVLGPSPTTKLGTTAVFFDPPYAVADRDTVYAAESFSVAHDVRAWCLEHGADPLLRIALCGYDEHDELAAAGWAKKEWKASGGFANQDSRGTDNAAREVVWFSPHCQTHKRQLGLVGL